MVFELLKKIGKRSEKKGMAMLEVILEENRGIGRYKSIKSLLKFVQEISTDDPAAAAVALKLAIIEYIQRHNLPEEEKQKLVKALIQRPNRVNTNIEPIEIIDSAIYAVFIKRELQRVIDELPVTEERKVEYLAEITEIIRSVLFTRALKNVRGPADIKRISMAFGVPEESIRSIIQPKTKTQRNYNRKKKTYRKPPRNDTETQEQKKSEQENNEQKKGGDSE